MFETAETLDRAGQSHSKIMASYNSFPASASNDQPPKPKSITKIVVLVAARRGVPGFSVD